MPPLYSSKLAPIPRKVMLKTLFDEDPQNR